VLVNAAAAITGMARSDVWREPLPNGMVAVSVYGITSAGANVAMSTLSQAGLMPVSFHANGVGGPTMEGQVAAGTFEAVLDWSITEIADEIVGGICAASDRLTNAVRLGLPQVIVPGGMDVVNFVRKETVPQRYQERQFYQHTPDAILMRTDISENLRAAEVVAERLNPVTVPVRILIPSLGFSALSGPGGLLNQPEADAAFEQQLRLSITNPLIQIDSLPLEINDPQFAAAAASALLQLLN
jgi:uncharacterized protein (UPF0261 family)